MQRADGQPDWRDAAAYAVLADADRSVFAWEWLRRDARYRTAARRYSRRGLCDGEGIREADPRAAEWGLHAMEAPDLPASLARPLWRAEVHPPVLRAAAGPAGPSADAFDLGRLAGLATLVRDRDDREHWLLSDGLRAIRLDLMAGTLRGGPVRLDYALTGVASAERPLLALRRLLVLCRGGRFARSLHGPGTRARRWIVLLRAWDALSAGASQREIAAVLLDPDVQEPGWRTSMPSVRLRAQRLAHGARTMAEDGYRVLLA